MRRLSIFASMKAIFLILNVLFLNTVLMGQARLFKGNSTYSSDVLFNLNEGELQVGGTAASTSSVTPSLSVRLCINRGLL